MSTTIDQPRVGTPPAMRPSTPSERTHLVRGLVLAVVLLAAGVVALGAWVAVDQFGGSTNSNQTLFNDLTKAWSSYDANAIKGLYAPDAVITDATGDVTTGTNGVLDWLSGFQSLGGSVEPVGKVAANGEYVASFVRFSDGDEALTLLQVRNGKIVRHWDLGPGTTAPLLNALK